MIDWSWWLMEIGTWLIAVGLTLGAFAGLLWCFAKMCELNDRR